MDFEIQEYQIVYSKSAPTDWSKIPALDIQNYPWYVSGKKQATQVKLAHNGQTLWVHFFAEDQYSSATRTILNSDVCNDSCVEFFFSPRDQRGSSYFNAEINCIGTVHLAYGPDRENRELSTQEQVDFLNIQSQFKGTQKVESSDDLSWTVDFEIPLELINSWSQEELTMSGTWWANFFRCGGNIDPQYATWNPILKEQPDYHRPEQFGKLVFAELP